MAPWLTVAIAGATVTEVKTGGTGTTVIEEIAVTVIAPETAVAVMVVVPTATPVTSPVALTVATAAFEVDQVTVAPTKGRLD